MFKLIERLSQQLKSNNEITLLLKSDFSIVVTIEFILFNNKKLIFACTPTKCDC